MNAMPSGENEFDIFQNYYNAEKKRIKFFVNTLVLQSKDDVIAERLRGLVKEDFQAKNYRDCLKKYTECLCYATCNGREYAMALANRSATYLAMKKYTNCIIDINLSLQADYPINLKPKLVIRKANCLIKLGKLKEMFETIDECCKLIQDSTNLPKTHKDNYLKEIESLMDIKQVDLENLPCNETVLDAEVIREENRLNPNVSASIKFKYNRNTGIDYVAARDIPCGEVLFVDKAYAIAFTSTQHDPDYIETFFCDYCWNETNNCIPCKSCMHVEYCSENCRENSWSDYHRWECDILFRSDRSNNVNSLSLRTLIKAACSGVIFQIKNNTKPFKPYKDMDPYLYIYSLHFDLANIRSKWTDQFIECCEQTALMVGFLEKTNFFTHLISTSSCQKEYPALVNFFGGLLLRLKIQMHQAILCNSYISPILLLNENQEKLELTSHNNMKLNAVCPAVSGLKYSCEANTSLYFNGGTCIVKACKNIQAGNGIFRSITGFSPRLPYPIHQFILDKCFLNCDSTGCKDINNSGNLLDTYLCIRCGRFTLQGPTPQQLMICSYCKYATHSELLLNKVSFIAYELANPSNDLSASVNKLQKMMNPNHITLYKLYTELLLNIYSKQDNIKELQNVLQSFKSCAENRNGKLNPFEYISDLNLICKAYFDFLQFNKSKLLKREINEMLNDFSDVVNEAKEIFKINDRPIMAFLAPIEFYILKFRVASLTL